MYVECLLSNVPGTLFTIEFLPCQMHFSCYYSQLLFNTIHYNTYCILKICFVRARVIGDKQQLSPFFLLNIALVTFAVMPINANLYTLSIIGIWDEQETCLFPVLSLHQTVKVSCYGTMSMTEYCSISVPLYDYLTIFISTYFYYQVLVLWNECTQRQSQHVKYD